MATLGRVQVYLKMSLRNTWMSLQQSQMPYTVMSVNAIVTDYNILLLNHLLENQVLISITKKIFLIQRSTHTLARNELLCQLLGGHRHQWISHKMNIRHPGQLKKIKSWGPFWSYQLNSTANLAHLPRKWPKLAELAVLFSWQLQNGLQDFVFFYRHMCRLLICNEKQ